MQVATTQDTSLVAGNSISDNSYRLLMNNSQSIED